MSKISTKTAETELTVSAPAYLDLFDELSRRGYLSEQDVDINRSDYLNPEVRVPLKDHDALWQMASNAGAPEHIGLLVGQQVNTEAKGLLSYLIAYSQDVKEGLSFYEKHISLMNEAEKMQLEFHSWGLRILFTSTGQAQLTNAHERLLSGLVAWGRELTAKDICPIRVSFTHAQPSYLEEYERVFGCETLFDQDQLFMDLRAEDLALKFVSSSVYMKQVMVNQIEQFKQTYIPDNNLITKVQCIILKNLTTGNFTADFVAQNLNMSRQSLHRRLKQHDVNFRELLEDTRKQEAINRLANDKYNIDNIGLDLGFKDTSSFYRAFKSWFDMTPGEYRQQVMLDR